MWLVVHAACAEGLHTLSPGCHEPWAGWCHEHGQNHQHAAPSCRSARIQTDLITHADRAAFSTWPEVFIDKKTQRASVSLAFVLINCGRKSALVSKPTYNCHRRVLQNSQFVCDSNEKLLLLCLHGLLLYQNLLLIISPVQTPEIIQLNAQQKVGMLTQ